MKSANLILATIASTGLLFSSCGGNQSGESENSPETATGQTSTEKKDVAVDLGSSTVKWEGSMIGVKTHYGTVALNEAKLTLSGDKVTGGSFEVDLTTITPQDDNYNEEHTKEKLINHLSSPDFFDVANHPTASFEVTEASEDGSSLSGKLTIRGITNEETVKDVKIEGDIISGKLTFDRKKYNVSWDSKMQDMVLSNDIPLTIKLKRAG